MKQMLLFIGIACSTLSACFSQGYNIGDKATDFKLKNVDGHFVSLSDYPSAKGFVIVFTCNHCPFAQAYQDRIIAIDNTYKPLGYPVIAINPNDTSLVSDDSYENMKTRYQEKHFTFPYLLDATQAVYRKYGATKTPHIYLLQKNGADFIVQYIGAIDDNYQDASKVTEPFLANAINALLAGRKVEPAVTKAIGCSIKDKQSQP